MSQNDNLQEWIKALLEKREKQPEPKVEEISCMDTHKLVLKVENSLQTQVHTIQDEMSLDTSTLMSLKPHVETLLSVFESFHLPGYKEATHVQTTLSLLQTLLNNYDSVMAALIHTRDTLNNYDSRHIISSSRLKEWSCATIDSLHVVKTHLLKHNDALGHFAASNSLLQQRLTKMERDRAGNQQLVLSLLEKLTIAEQTVVLRDQELDQNARLIRRLKSEVKVLKKVKDEIEGVGVISQLRKRTPSTSNKGTRQRAIDYGEQLRVKQKVRKTTPTHSRSSSRSQTPSSVFRKGREVGYDEDSDDASSEASSKKSDSELIADLLKASKLQNVASRYEALKKKFMNHPKSSRSRSRSRSRHQLDEATTRNTKKNSKSSLDDLLNPATQILLQRLGKVDRHLSGGL